LALAQALPDSTISVAIRRSDFTESRSAQRVLTFRKNKKMILKKDLVSQKKNKKGHGKMGAPDRLTVTKELIDCTPPLAEACAF
jgi:hypothetical protein